MAVLATSHDARSAVIAAGGRLLAAIQDWREPEPTDGPRSQVLNGAADACLTQAGLSLKDITVMAVVADGAAATSRTAQDCGPRPQVISPGEAHLAQAAGVAGASGLLIVVDDHVPQPIVARHAAGDPLDAQTSGRLGAAVALVRRTAAALGWPGTHAVAQLERIAGDADPEYVTPLLAASASADGGLDAARVEAILADVDRRCLGRLHEVNSAHRLVQEGRAALAASALGVLTATFAEVTDSENGPRSSGVVALAGSFFAHASLNARVAAAIGGQVAVAPVPDPSGLPLGAALAADRHPVNPIRHLALGRTPDEQEIKRILENCRLEYLYEPEWNRLLPRVSALLAAGKLVAWFQPPLDYGPRSFGSRSILADPSNRYVRENVNTYLLRQRVDEPIGVSTTSEAAADTFVHVPDSPFMLLDAAVKPETEKLLKGAIDKRGRCPVHISDDSRHPELHELLRVHRQNTGVPGLVNAGLYDVDGTLVSDPRGAIRAAFGSAVDVLVMGRFIVSKDYWLLRTQ